MVCYAVRNEGVRAPAPGIPLHKGTRRRSRGSSSLACPCGAISPAAPLIFSGGLAVESDSTIGWIRLTGKSRFRAEARPRDRVVQISTSLSRKRISFLEPCTIVFRQNVERWTRFYLRNRLTARRCRGPYFRRQPGRTGWLVYQRRLRGC